MEGLELRIRQGKCGAEVVVLPCPHQIEERIYVIQQTSGSFMVDSVILKTVRWVGEDKHSEKRSLSEERAHRGAGAVHSTGRLLSFPRTSENRHRVAVHCLRSVVQVVWRGVMAGEPQVVPYTWESRCPFPAGEVLGSRGSCDFPGSLEA